MKVLLVEDDPILTQMYKDEFEKSGVNFVSAREGKEGIVQAAKETPDFILLDIMMGSVDGVRVFKQLKQMPETKDIPTAFLTVVPEGVPQGLNKDPNLLEGSVGYWSKDKYTPMDRNSKRQETAEMLNRFLE
jgi:CheY-like chemotaxis protein